MIKIRDWMTKEVKTIKETATAVDAAKEMDTHSIGSLIIMDGEKPKGIVTERDIITKVVAVEKNPAEITVGDVMTTKLTTVPIDATLLDVSKLMNKNYFRTMIIVDDEGNLAGIITAKDLIELVSA